MLFLDNRKSKVILHSNYDNMNGKIFLHKFMNYRNNEVILYIFMDNRNSYILENMSGLRKDLVIFKYCYEQMKSNYFKT